MQFDIITIFPKLFDSFLNESLIKKSIQKKVNKICVHDLRQWSKGKHKQVDPVKSFKKKFNRVDDRPYGGGPGMILMAEPIVRAIARIQKIKKIKKQKNDFKSKIILLSPAGKQFDQKMAKKFSKLDQLILICGRYEGVDARIDKIIDKKISVGPYILSGGELPAMTIIETVSRLITGYLGNPESLKEETQINKKEYPQYTRPEILSQDLWIDNKNYRVPKILLSGDHKKIQIWKKQKSKTKK